MKHYFYFLLMSCFLLCGCGNGSSSKDEGNKQRETEILRQLTEINSERQRLTELTNESYNRYWQRLQEDALGAQINFNDLRKYQKKMKSLCDRYVELARELGDEAILHEAVDLRSNIMQSYDNMFAEIGAD